MGFIFQGLRFVFSLGDCGGAVDLLSPDTSASQLFDALAECIEELIKDNKDSQADVDAPSKLGFTFSFPCIQTVGKRSFYYISCLLYLLIYPLVYFLSVFSSLVPSSDLRAFHLLCLLLAASFFGKNFIYFEYFSSL